MNKKIITLEQNFNNKYYGLKGGAANPILGVDQFGKMILSESILQTKYNKSTRTLWATKYFEVDMDNDGFYKVIDKDVEYVFEVKNGEIIEHKLTTNNKIEICNKIKQMLGEVEVEITEKNADIVATETEDSYRLKMPVFSWKVLADIKTIEGRKYDPSSKEWIITKEQKDSLIELGYTIIFKTLA